MMTSFSVTKHFRNYVLAVFFCLLAGFSLAIWEARGIAQAALLGCQEFQGITEEWMRPPERTFSNTKSMNFNPLRLSPNYNKTCAWYNPADVRNFRTAMDSHTIPGVDNYDDSGYLVEGWMWNTNIGWISTSCRDISKLLGREQDYFCNNGVDYGVYMIPGGELRGFAYSPKIGWILFHFADGQDAWTTYKPKANLVEDNGYAELTGYVWSPYIGYFKLDGAKFPLEEITPDCLGAYITLGPGSDAVLCPAIDDLTGEFLYNNTPKIECTGGTGPVVPYDWRRVDRAQEPQNPPAGQFTVGADPNNSAFGKLNWPVSHDYCWGRDWDGNGQLEGAEAVVTATIKADNFDTYGQAGHETSDKVVTINLYDSCEAPNNPVFTWDSDGDGDQDAQDGDHTKAFVGNTYYYEVSVPLEGQQNGWTPNVFFTLTGGPQGMTLRQSTEPNKAILEWLNPTSSGSPYTISFKAQNSCQVVPVSFRLEVREQEPRTLSNCPDKAFINNNYQCEIEVDAEELPRATLPVTWSVESQNFSNMAGGAGLWIDLGVNADEQNPTPVFNLISQLVVKKPNGDIWQPQQADKNKTFDFRIRVSNRAGGASKPYTVTVTDQPVPPVIAESDLNGVFYTFQYGQPGGLPYSKKYNFTVPAGTEPLKWQVSVKELPAEGEMYADTDVTAPTPCVSDNANGVYSQNQGEKVRNCASINHFGRIEFAPNSPADERKLYKIYTKVFNKDKYVQSEDCGTSQWCDFKTINNFAAGYNPVIKSTLVGQKLDNQFVFGQPGIYDLRKLTRDCVGAPQQCPYQSSSNADPNLPISGTPKVGIAQSQGFRNWTLTFPSNQELQQLGAEAANGMTIDPATGILSWTPGSTGKKAITLNVTNDFGVAQAVNIVFNVPTAPEIVMDPLVEWMVDTNYTKYVGVRYSSQDDPRVTKWGFEDKTNDVNTSGVWIVDPAGTGITNDRLSIVTSGNRAVVKLDNAQELLSIRYRPETADLEGILEWLPVKFGNTVWRFRIYAENSLGVRGKHTFDFRVLTTPVDNGPVQITEDYDPQYEIQINTLGLIPFTVGDTGVGDFGWDYKIYTLESNVWAEYIPPTAYNDISTAENTRSTIFGFKPEPAELDLQNSFSGDEGFYLNMEVTDNGEGDPSKKYDSLSDNQNQMLTPAINTLIKLIITDEIPPENPADDPWSQVVESEIGGTINIRDEVYGDREGTNFTRIGDIQASLNRDEVFANMLGLIRGVRNPGAGGRVKQAAGPALTTAEVIKGKVLLNGKALYFEGGNNPPNVDKVVIDNDDNPATVETLEWNGHQMIIVYGANLFINDNLWPNNDGNDGTLDIVVLKKPGQTDKGVAGNVLVDNNVTHIKANIFADGGFFNYDAETWDEFGPASDDTFLKQFGYPDYMGDDESGGCDPQGSYKAYVACMDGEQNVTLLKHQLRLQGSLNARNTIGGAEIDETTDSFVLALSKNGYGQSAFSLTEALAYDLSLFRFFHKNFDKGACAAAGEYVDHDGDGSCKDESLLNYKDQVMCRPATITDLTAPASGPGVSCDPLDPNATENSALIIKYQPYSSESRIFRRGR